MAVLEVSDAVIVIIFVLKVANPVGICVDTVIEWVDMSINISEVAAGSCEAVEQVLREAEAAQAGKQKRARSASRSRRRSSPTC